jgi:MarR family transcriptional regulator, organic hydroperoxide resistance regulator
LALDRLLTASKPELLDGDDDRTLRALLHDYFAFAHCLEVSRAKFAKFVGLSATQYMILIAIAHAPADEPLGIGQIADKLHLSGAFVTIEVNKLVADRLVDKSGHPSDGRRVQLAVTTKGLDRLTRLAAFQRPVNDALFGMLSRDEFRQLAHLLSRVADNGGNAVKLAAHIEATIALRRHAPRQLEPRRKARRQRAG